MSIPVYQTVPVPPTPPVTVSDNQECNAKPMPPLIISNIPSVPATDQRTALSDCTSSGSEMSVDMDEDEENFDSVSARMYHKKHKKKEKYASVRVKRSDIAQHQQEGSCDTFQMQQYVEPEINATHTFLSNFPDSSDDDVNL